MITQNSVTILNDINVESEIRQHEVSSFVSIVSQIKEVRDKFNYFGYQVWPMSAVNEMRRLTNQVKKELPAVKCPALVIHSTEDMLSIPENISLVYDNISSERKEKLIVTQASHNLFISNPDQDLIFQKITSFFNQFRGN